MNINLEIITQDESVDFHNAYSMHNESTPLASCQNSHLNAGDTIYPLPNDSKITLKNTNFHLSNEDMHFLIAQVTLYLHSNPSCYELDSPEPYQNCDAYVKTEISDSMSCGQILFCKINDLQITKVHDFWRIAHQSVYEWKTRTPSAQPNNFLMPQPAHIENGTDDITTLENEISDLMSLKNFSLNSGTNARFIYEPRPQEISPNLEDLQLTQDFMLMRNDSVNSGTNTVFIYEPQPQELLTVPEVLPPTPEVSYIDDLKATTRQKAIDYLESHRHSGSDESLLERQPAHIEALVQNENHKVRMRPNVTFDKRNDYIPQYLIVNNITAYSEITKDDINTLFYRLNKLTCPKRIRDSAKSYFKGTRAGREQDYPLLNVYMSRWVRKLKSENKKPTLLEIKQKAREVKKGIEGSGPPLTKLEKNLTNWKISNGWMKCFRQKNGLLDN